MDRFLMNDLKKWAANTNRKPLIIKGARQVGKTWLMTEFGRSCFNDVFYLNFENTPGMDELFAGGRDGHAALLARLGGEV